MEHSTNQSLEYNAHCQIPIGIRRNRDEPHEAIPASLY